VIVEGIQKVRPGVKVSATPEKTKEAASPASNAPPADGGPKEAKGK
jgi:hypothetical protein